MSDAFRLWCKHFTSRSLVSQKDMHVTSDRKTRSQNIPETGTEKAGFTINKENFLHR